MSPQEYRAAMTASYRASYDRAGIVASDREVEALVLADLHLVDAARAAGDLNRPPGPDAPIARADRASADIIAAAERETGTELRTGGETVRFAVTHGNPMEMSSRWGAAVARIQLILEHAGRGATIGAAVDHATRAKEFAETWSHFMTRAGAAPSGRDHNPFRGMSDRDASRAFMRAVEDICDRSTGEFGSWHA